MKCLLCGSGIKNELTLKQLLAWQPVQDHQVCQVCWGRFEWIIGAACRGCGHPQTTTELCGQCQEWQQQTGFLLVNRSLLHYNEALHDFMQQYKFVGDYRLRQVFAAPLQAMIATVNADVIVPIPVTPATWKERGFNQVTGMLSHCDWKPLIETRAHHKQERQSHKNRQERLATKQPFEMVGAALAQTPINGRRVLLVDDVYTTGRTLYHAAALCRSYHPSQIESITLAR